IAATDVAASHARGRRFDTRPAQLIGVGFVPPGPPRTSGPAASREEVRAEQESHRVAGPPGLQPERSGCAWDAPVPRPLGAYLLDTKVQEAGASARSGVEDLWN